MVDWEFYLVLFNWVSIGSPVGDYLSRPPLLASLEVLLGSLIFQKKLLGISMTIFLHFLV